MKFDDKIEEHTSRDLKLLKDDRIFKWTAVRDSHPDDSVTPFKQHGVVGFDFGKLFTEESTNKNNGNYQYPYLQLLKHLWPGKFKNNLYKNAFVLYSKLFVIVFV